MSQAAVVAQACGCLETPFCFTEPSKYSHCFVQATLYPSPLLPVFFMGLDMSWHPTGQQTRAVADEFWCGCSLDKSPSERENCSSLYKCLPLLSLSNTFSPIKQSDLCSNVLKYIILTVMYITYMLYIYCNLNSFIPTVD